jgi:hypothetical protein
MSAQWLEPWYPIEDARQRALLQEELDTELSEAHELFGGVVLVIAKRDDQDDILVEIKAGRVAEVHLTWSRQKETNPGWPKTKIFHSLDNWKVERMRPLHEEYEA